METIKNEGIDPIEEVIKNEGGEFIPEAFDFEKELARSLENAFRREVTDEVQNALDSYFEDSDLSILESVMEEQVAYAIDVIYKESVRTFKEEVYDEFQEKGTITTSFTTPYRLFDKDKVFFAGRTILEGDEEVDYTWGYPITISKNDDYALMTPWENHNYIYREWYTWLDNDGKIRNYRQDVDIFGTEDSWGRDLLKALYMTVGALYDYWTEMKNFREMFGDDDFIISADFGDEEDEEEFMDED